MKLLALSLASIVAILLVAVIAHFSLVEIGQEVVTLRTPLPDDEWYETRLWVVDHDGDAWLHSAGDAWAARFEGDPVIELDRGGETRRYKADPVPGPHPEIDALLRDKYGIADRWVRIIAPCNESVLLVRLVPMPAQ